MHAATQPGLAVNTQAPLLGSQLSVVHASLSSQTLLVAVLQVPDTHEALSTQALPGSQVLPSGAAMAWHTPAMQSATWHEPTATLPPQFSATWHAAGGKSGRVVLSGCSVVSASGCTRVSSGGVTVSPGGVTVSSGGVAPSSSGAASGGRG